MDLKSYTRWYDYSRARDAMFAATDTAWAPWYVADSDDKKRARLNIISHLLGRSPTSPHRGSPSCSPIVRSHVATANPTTPTATSQRSTDPHRHESGGGWPGVLSSEPDAQPGRPDGDAEGSFEPSGLWARVRNSLRVPGALVRLARRDPHHIPERLTIYAVDRQADAARAWAQRARDAAPNTSPSALADGQRRRTISTARVDGAVAGTPFFIALVPAYIAFLRQEVRFHLRVAALHGHDPAEPSIAADFLVLRGVHDDAEQALAELEIVRATPLPPPRARTPPEVLVQRSRQHPHPRGLPEPSSRTRTHENRRPGTR